VHTGATIQFDLAAVFPGDWNHVVFLSYHEINCHGNTAAKNGEAWFFEADDGENRNGFNYYGNFVLGYQMPIMLNMAAFLTEMELYLYNSPAGLDRKIWGDDLIRWTFSGILNFALTDQLSMTLLAQFRTRRNFTNFDSSKQDGSQADKDEMFYQKRILNTGDPMRLEFYRIAGVFTYRL
jgi:hypothetical protein